MGTGLYDLLDAMMFVPTNITIKSVDSVNQRVSIPEIKDVIFNNPATIVFWADGSKTIVKCQNGDTYSKETGLAMAIAKKAYGNKGELQ